MTVKKKKILTIFAAVLFLGLGILLAVVFIKPPQIYINEICSTNNGKMESVNKVVDKNGDYCDWIEIFNPTDKDISLADFVLCKNGVEYSIGDYRVASECFIIVYCSSKGFDENVDAPHADFSIGKASEDTYTLKYGYYTVDSVKTTVVDKGNSYSRDNEGKMYVSTPTPAAENAQNVIGATPVFSRESGMYDTDFDLEITAGEGQKIYYTLDGTDPETSATRIEYTGAFNIYDRSSEENTISAYDPAKVQLDYRPGNIDIPDIAAVDKGTVVRACAEGTDGSFGTTVTATYFVGVSNADHSDLPIISVVTDPENLYNEKMGIYCLGDVFTNYASEHQYYYNGSVPANYNQTGRDWERACYIEYFDSEGNLQLSQDAGMRIQGGWSRADYQKSFRFYARSEYGKGSFDYAFWDDLTTADGKDTPLESFDTFVIRNGGNDANYSKFKDTMIQNLVSGDNYETQSGKACVLFIDGEYWGLYTLQEDYSAEHFANTYGVNESDVAIYKNGELDVGTTQDEQDFLNLRNFICDSDMSQQENYKKVCAQIDMENFINYVALECYIYNNDWPQNNYGCWRTRTTTLGNEYSDGRWRFFVFDTESSMNHYNTNLDETTTFKTWSENKHSILGGMVVGMLDNAEFRQQLVTSIMDLANINFSYDHFSKTLKEYKSVYYNELLRYFKRFPTWAHRDNATDRMIERMLDFVYKRPDRICEMLEDEFDLSEQRKLTVTSNDFEGGNVILDNSQLDEKLDARYYDGCKITLSAQAKDGWVFVGWEGYDSDDETITVEIDGDMNITAVYERSIL